jgi:hypothetical protein
MGNVSGNITLNGSPLVGISVGLSWLNSPYSASPVQLITATTDASGNYSLPIVISGAAPPLSLRVIPLSSEYTFSPASIDLSTDYSGVGGQNFAASLVSFALTVTSSGPGTISPSGAIALSGAPCAGSTQNFEWCGQQGFVSSGSIVGVTVDGVPIPSAYLSANPLFTVTVGIGQATAAPTNVTYLNFAGYQSYSSPFYVSGVAASHTIAFTFGSPSSSSSSSSSGGSSSSSSSCPASSSSSVPASSSSSQAVVGPGSVAVVWHDNRFGNYQIMAATQTGGSWQSSAQGGADVRITNSAGNSLFPRIAADSQSNIRVVYEDYRRGSDNPWIYMSSFLSSMSQWYCSGQGEADVPVTPTGTAESLNPDIAIDVSDGIFVVWADSRFKTSTPPVGMQVMGNYALSTVTSTSCVAPLCTDAVSYLPTDFQVVDCVTGEVLQIVGTPNVCLRITCQGATYFRAANETGPFTSWTAFQPNQDLNTMVVPWTLSPGNGQKQVCIQTQDPSIVGYAACQTLVLQALPASFKIAFFQDIGLTQPLPTFSGYSVATSGDMYVSLISSVPLAYSPTFDVVGQGANAAFGQEAQPVNGSSTNFVGRITIKQDDGIFNKDGLARIIPHGETASGEAF